jgi:hypothetical protein
MLRFIVVFPGTSWQMTKRQLESGCKGFLPNHLQFIVHYHLILYNVNCKSAKTWLPADELGTTFDKRYEQQRRNKHMQAVITNT